MSLIHADARQIPLVDGCVQCVVTSPPYFGLRDYGNPKQIGLEATPEAYVAEVVGVFREVRRVLADDGVLWLNLGDSYYGARQHGSASRVHGLKSKDLIGMPWRVALALQQPWYRCGVCQAVSHASRWLVAPEIFAAEETGLIGFCPGCCGSGPMHIAEPGWYLRADVIWSKPNPMPESVTDRPTKAHEYLFLLTKCERYQYDAQAIGEPVSAAMWHEMQQGYDGLGRKDYDAAGVQNPSSVKARIIANARRKAEAAGGTLSRNCHSVWTVNATSYLRAHFAVMPEQLAERCILAGSRPGDRVFDPFLGSGTVGAVAERLRRQWVGMDLNPAYLQLAKTRTAQRGLRFEAD